MKIIITGGHITPALAVIEVIQKNHPSWDIVFVGRVQALEGSGIPSYEEDLVAAKNILFIPLKTGRLTRVFHLKSLLSILKIPIGFIQSFVIVYKQKPDAILSFGGYIGLPVVIAAWLLRIPSYIHEQTSYPGIANKLTARCAKNVFVTHAFTEKYFPRKKTVTTGLPLRKSVFHPPKSTSFSLKKKLPIIYITGGSTGAQSMNELIFPIIPELVFSFTIVHQLGKQHMENATHILKELPKSVREHYIPKEYLDEKDVSYLYHNAVLVMGRSGANTTIEVSAVGNIGLWIPLPWSAGNEQLLNAKMLETHKTSIVINQMSASPDLLLRTIRQMNDNRTRFLKHAKRYAKHIKTDAAKRIVQIISSS